jgi:UDP-glucose 4-epimerase
LAALINVEASVKNPFETHDVNVNGTLNVLKEAVRAGVKRFVFASSTAVYGDANPLPLREDYPLRPISPYAASKAAAEGYCRAFNSCYGLGTVVLRYFNVYGLGQRNSAYSGVITRFLDKAFRDEPLIVYGDGGQTRDFIYVDDDVKATILALEGVGV